MVGFTYQTDQVMAVIGQRGTGKSFFSKYMAKQCPKRLIYDPMHEHGDCGGVITTISDLQDCFNRNWKRLVYQPLKNTTEEFETINRLLYNYQRDLVYMVEEVGNHCSPYKIPEWLGVLVRLGRHKGIGFIGISQRARHFHGDILSQAHHIVSFRQEYPKDIEHLREYLGDRAFEVNLLPDYYYFVRSKRKNLGVFPPLKV